MKELTIEEKAARYDEALKVAKGLYANGAPDSLHLERMFPVLKESEDERMLRVLREGFSILDKDDEWYRGITNGQILAWLKKRGEMGTNGNEREIPNSVWSEEDMETIDRIYNFIWKNRKGDTSEIYQQEKDANWLKSLKERYTWKPSDEQPPISMYGNIEYTRTDAFIEKAFEFFGEHLCEYIEVKNANCDTFINIDGDKLKEDFKDYMKGK